MGHHDSLAEDTIIPIARQHHGWAATKAEKRRSPNDQCRGLPMSLPRSPMVVDQAFLRRNIGGLMRVPLLLQLAGSNRSSLSNISA
jgi:hypothetical protein